MPVSANSNWVNRMRSLIRFGMVLAAGLSLVACTQQGGDATARTGAARQPAGVAAQGADVAASSSSPAEQARFASLPDRGELLRYDAQAPIRDGAYTWHRTELSEQHALDAIAGGMLRVVAPNGRVLGFQYDRSVRHPESGDWTWIGHLPGQEGVQAILTFGAGAVYGSIGQPDTRPLRLTMRGGTSWLVETDPTKFAGLASLAANPVSPDYQIVSPAALERLRELQPAAGTAGAAGAAKPAALAPKTGAAAAATTTVDLLIGYTQGFVTAQGGTANAVTRLNSLVDTANAGLVNSQVSGQIRLVHTMQVNYTDTNSNETALNQLTGSDGQKDVPVNAAFNALRAARETYGADLVSLVRPFRDPEQEGCGIAWLVGGGKQPVTADNGWQDFGYSVVGDGTDKNEQDGKSYYCEDLTLAHELGHNMGSAHDRATQMSDDGKLDNPDDYGAFDYSFGYKPAAFYTIMAYGDSGQTSYLTFSNPRTKFCGGVACGVNNSEDNAKSLGFIMPPVSGFRATVVSDTVTQPVRADFNGDGKSDILWRNSSTGANAIWKSASSSSSLAVNTLDTAWKVAGVGDFNGDGIADILWRNSSTGANSIWKSANSATPQGVAALSNLAWQVAGIGDFDGDGKADILWRNVTTGANAIWKSGNSTTSQAINSVSTTWKVAGVGDFNGDGKSDILWRNSSTDANSIWKSGNISTPQTVASMPGSAWQVAGVGDFDGDGRSDILWRNDTTGANAVWKSANSNTPQAINNVSAAWKVVGVGDFNADGKSDILWRHSSTGANSIWRSANSGTPQGVAGLSNLAWEVVGIAP